MKPQPAIKPDYFADYKQVIEKAEPAPEQELIDEKFLHNLYEHDGFPVLKRYIGELKKQVEEVGNQYMEVGASFEEIGKNAVIIKLVQKYLDRVIEKVTDSYEAIEHRGPGEPSGGK